MVSTVVDFMNLPIQSERETALFASVGLGDCKRQHLPLIYNLTALAALRVAFRSARHAHCLTLPPGGKGEQSLS